MAVLTREPVARPYDVIALEIILTIASAIQVGLLLWLAVDAWGDRGAGSGPMLAVLAVLGLLVGAGWLAWLLGRGGWVLATSSGVVALLMLFFLLLDLSGGDVGDLGSGVALTSLAAAALGAACGVFLPSPLTPRWNPAPRVRSRPGGPPLPPPRVTPTFARTVDRLPKSVPMPTLPTGATAALGARLKRSGHDAEGTIRITPPAEPRPTLQPRAGTTARPAPEVPTRAGPTTNGAATASPAPRPAPAPGARPAGAVPDDDLTRPYGPGEEPR